MIPELRKQFNERWAPELYLELLRRLDAVSGTHVDFRCSETPIFLPNELLAKAVRYGQELYAQLAVNNEYRQASDAAIPSGFRVPNETAHPLFLQADFGLVREPDGTLEPKLVEIQGFPSIYGFQAALAKQYQLIYKLEELDEHLTPFLGDLDGASYSELLGRAILNGHSPENVVLLEIEPHKQKTLPDFLITQRRLGIRIASITEVKKRGSRLYYEDVPIERIYNRVIVDELVRKNIHPAFQLTDDLDVEWAGHPNWFFRISKFSLPWLRHRSVPETWFLNEIKQLPEDLGSYVLKPLYSFAGLGIKIGPSRGEIAAIPDRLRHEYILQRRLEFVPTVETPSGPTKVEIRIMYIWDNGLRPVTTVVRTGRGQMMGVDFNKNLNWVGASAGFWSLRYAGFEKPI
ncbi:MAG TPA: hypothetical protein VLI55_17095 [Bryobacteraceae bacterium]|nr:hypothetical protein [Bryobacteraceae bacterium]